MIFIHFANCDWLNGARDHQEFSRSLFFFPENSKTSNSMSNDLICRQQEIKCCSRRRWRRRWLLVTPLAAAQIDRRPPPALSSQFYHPTRNVIIPPHQYQSIYSLPLTVSTYLPACIYHSLSLPLPSYSVSFELTDRSPPRSHFNPAFWNRSQF